MFERLRWPLRLGGVWLTARAFGELWREAECRRQADADYWAAVSAALSKSPPDGSAAADAAVDRARALRACERRSPVLTPLEKAVRALTGTS